MSRIILRNARPKDLHRVASILADPTVQRLRPGVRNGVGFYSVGIPDSAATVYRTKTATVIFFAHGEAAE